MQILQFLRHLAVNDSRYTICSLRIAECHFHISGGEFDGRAREIPFKLNANFVSDS